MMVFRPPARETIESLRSILQNLEETTDPESADLAYLRCVMLERIDELEAAQKVESSAREIPSTDREAA
jgi:hypothetical protein